MPDAPLKIVHNTCRDSIALMQISAKIAALSGVHQASVMMAAVGIIADSPHLAAALAGKAGTRIVPG